jgi:hypothetical protein
MFSRLGPAHGNRNPSHQSEIVQLQLQGWPSTWIRSIEPKPGDTHHHQIFLDHAKQVAVFLQCQAKCYVMKMHLKACWWTLLLASLAQKQFIQELDFVSNFCWGFVKTEDVGSHTHKSSSISPWHFHQFLLLLINLDLQQSKILCKFPLCGFIFNCAELLLLGCSIASSSTVH